MTPNIPQEINIKRFHSTNVHMINSFKCKCSLLSSQQFKSRAISEKLMASSGKVPRVLYISLHGNDFGENFHYLKVGIEEFYFF